VAGAYSLLLAASVGAARLSQKRQYRYYSRAEIKSNGCA